MRLGKITIQHITLKHLLDSKADLSTVTHVKFFTSAHASNTSCRVLKNFTCKFPNHPLALSSVQTVIELVLPMAQ